MARQFANDPPYQVSRAALREKYGPRSIDASAPQSAKDSTPSGRAAYLAQSQNIPLSQAEGQQAQELKDSFKFQNPAEQPRMLSRAMIQNPVAKEPLPFDQTPFQSAFQPQSFGLQPPLGLIPTTTTPEDMSEFLPSTASPLNNFSLPKIPKTFLGQPLNNRFG